jgi:hypothetical protein
MGTGGKHRDIRRSLTPMAGSSASLSWAQEVSWISLAADLPPTIFATYGSYYFLGTLLLCDRQASYYNAIYSRMWWKRLLSGHIFCWYHRILGYRQATYWITLRRKLITKSVVYSRMKWAIACSGLGQRSEGKMTRRDPNYIDVHVGSRIR